MMENTRDMKKTIFQRAERGFTLIELLVVIAVIAVLMSIIMPALSKAKVAARKVICGNQQKQIGMSLAMYAEQNNDSLGLNYAANRLWDVSYITTDFVLENGGDRRTFYCPLNTTIRSDLTGYWRFSETRNYAVDVSESALPPEPASRKARSEDHYRVTSYFWLLERKSKPTMYGTPEFEFSSKYTRMKNASCKELVTDATLSNLENPDAADCTFTQVTGGSWDRWGRYDPSNHLGRNQKVTDINVLFGDGHVDRRHFGQMRIWVGGPGKYQWW